MTQINILFNKDGWIQRSGKNSAKQVNDGDEGNEDEKEEVCIERDVLIQLHCKRGETVTVENYKALCRFKKIL